MYIVALDVVLSCSCRCDGTRLGWIIIKTSGAASRPELSAGGSFSQQGGKRKISPARPAAPSTIIN